MSRTIDGMDDIYEPTEFHNAVEKLVQWHKERGEWVDEGIAGAELQFALETIVKDLLEEPLDYFPGTYRHVHMHYDPREHPMKFATKEEAEKALPEAEEFFGVPIMLSHSTWNNMWYIYPKDE